METLTGTLEYTSPQALIHAGEPSLLAPKSPSVVAVTGNSTGSSATKVLTVAPATKRYMRINGYVLRALAAS